MELTCPNCNSDNTQRLSAVFENGISTVNNKTHGVGMGLGRGGLAIGAAGASTSGTSQTVLSQRAAPPDRKPYLVPLGWIYRAAQYNAKTWPVQVEQWQRSFLCHRCHHVFVPNPSTESL